MCFVKKTATGTYGKTAKYWKIYVNMVHMYHTFSRAMLSGDLDIYVTTLTNIANYIFALNHPNYAR